MRQVPRLLFVISVLLAMFLTLAGCGPGKELTVTINEYKFEPERITVRQQNKVTLTVVNQGSLEHSFDVPALNISSGVVQPGATETIEFTVQALGRYKIISSVSGDEKAGMVGQLLVNRGTPGWRRQPSGRHSATRTSNGAESARQCIMLPPVMLIAWLVI